MPTPRPPARSPGVNRRAVLRLSATGVGAVLFGPSVLSACGDDDDGDAGPATTGETSPARATTGSTAVAGTGAGPLVPTALQLSWTHSVQFGGSYLAADRGYYADEGLDITFGAGGPNVAGDAQTVSGAALMNISVADGVARSNAEGAGLTIVGMQYQKAPPTLLALAEKDLTTPEALIGTRIAVAGADTPALDAFLRYNSIDPADIELVPSQYDPAVLTADQADSIFCFYNDLPVALAVQGVDHTAMLLADFGYNPASQVHTVLTEALGDDRRDQILRLLRAEIRGWQDYRSDFEEAATLAVERYPDAGLDPEVQRIQAEVQLDLMYNDVTDEHGFAWFTDEVVDENLTLLDDLGIAGVDAALFDRSLLEEIFADGPTI